MLEQRLKLAREVMEFNAMFKYHEDDELRDPQAGLD